VLRATDQDLEVRVVIVVERRDRMLPTREHLDAQVAVIDPQIRGDAAKSWTASGT